jgi:hypothetical protein
LVKPLSFPKFAYKTSTSALSSAKAAFRCATIPIYVLRRLAFVPVVRAVTVVCQATLRRYMYEGISSIGVSNMYSDQSTGR